MFRIGIGYDVHQLATSETLILGGVNIPHEKGTVGHSDADVLLHAVSDALLGALALGDIGQHFPDTDPKYKGADSRVLLRNVVELIHSKGYTINNIDCTLCLQRPKVKDYISEMRVNIASDLNTSLENISVKATTTEKLGFVGREEGVSAYCVVMLNKM